MPNNSITDDGTKKLCPQCKTKPINKSSRGGRCQKCYRDGKGGKSTNKSLLNLEDSVASLFVGALSQQNPQLQNAAFTDNHGKEDVVAAVQTQEQSSQGSSLQIESLPELPTNWATTPVSELTGGHLLKIILTICQPLQEKIDILEKQNKEHLAKITKNTDSINDLQKNAADQENEVATLKKVILNQQMYLEGIRKKECANNIIITGIPNGDLQCNDVVHTETEGKVSAILKETDASVSAESYKLVKFKPADGRDTHVCKLIFKNYEDKMKVFTKSNKLKQNNAMKKVFLKWDEPKLTRLENDRLRSKKKKMSEDYPDETIELKKGILYRNSIECDKINIENQIF